MVKTRAAWIQGSLPSLKFDDNAATMLAAAVTIVMGFGLLRMWQGGGAPAQGDLDAWVPSQSFSQAYRVGPHAPSVAGAYLLPKEVQPGPETAAPKAPVAVRPSRGDFEPMTDAPGYGLAAKSMGDSETSPGRAGATAQATPKPAQAAGALAAVTHGESRPFVSARVIHTGSGARFRQAAVGSVGGGTNFAGSSSGGSWDVVAGPSATTAASGAAAGASSLASSAAGAPTLSGFDPTSGSNSLTSVAPNQSSSGEVQKASSQDISQHQQQLVNDDLTLRNNVALPAVNLLSSMIQSVSDPTNPNTLMFAVRTLEAPGATPPAGLNPPVAQVDSLLTAAGPCLQQLSQQSDLPEDPQGALLCETQAQNSINAYYTWPSQLTGVYQPLGTRLQNNPPWSFVSAQAGSQPASWAQTTRTVMNDIQGLLNWAHSVQLPSWEPTWEQHLDGAYASLQSAAPIWDSLEFGSTPDANKGTQLAIATQQTTTALADLDLALQDMGCDAPQTDFQAGMNGISCRNNE